MGVQRLVKPCRQLLESCGAKTKVLVWEVGGETYERYYGEFVYECKYSEACAFVKSGFEWRWVERKGLEVCLSGKEELRSLLEGFRRLAGGWRGSDAGGVGAERSTELAEGGGRSESVPQREASP